MKQLEVAQYLMEKYNIQLRVGGVLLVVASLVALLELGRGFVSSALWIIGGVSITLGYIGAKRPFHEILGVALIYAASPIGDLIGGPAGAFASTAMLIVGFLSLFKIIK